MTPSIHCLGKLLCITLFAVPSPLMEKINAHPAELSHLYTSFHITTLATKAAHTKALKAKAAIRSAAAKRAAARRAELRLIGMEAHILYEELQLSREGLNEKALLYALMGYHRLLKRHEIQNPDILTICDFGQSSSQKRMYVIDLYAKKLVSRNYVAHGISSGKQFASSFSNTPESHKSSLGFYVTRNTYVGENGLSLRLDGFDRGFNTLAGERNIVIHGAPYVSDRILEKYGVMGTTYGCPAIPEELSRDLIPVLTGGSCFFIYYPSQRYLSHSSVLNG
jgi:hypothetical protein